MSVISNQVKELRETAEMFDQIDDGRRMLLQAADTIESLLVRLAMVNCGGWISCEDRFPKESGKYIIHVKTGTGEDYVGMWLFERGVHLSGSQTYVDDKKGYWASPYNGDPINEPLSKNVIAWQPLPEPYNQ